MTVTEALKKFPKAHKLVVENVTMGKEGKGYGKAMNLAMDTRLYNWNSDTVKAIKAVIG